MFNQNTLAAGVAALVCGLALSPSAHAVTQSRTTEHIGSEMCKLSIPTTDSKVRPKASGFRNEGTTNVFVICTFNGPPGSAGYANALIYPYSMDGANHPAVTCTGVNSLADGTGVGIPAPQFIPVTHDVNNTGTFGAFGVQFIWNASDFGPDPTIPGYQGEFSVTCVLPPQVGIKLGFANSVEDVGT